MSKPILCLDFDGVIHSYTSGWQGPGIVSDPPVPGAIDFLRHAIEHFEIHIFSSRSHQEGGLDGMRVWLGYHIAKEFDPEDLTWALDIKWSVVKPPAMVTLDDRALTFTGIWPPMSELLAFKPWNKP